MFCTFSRPKYQVNVYRTIGPLVAFMTAFVDFLVKRLYMYFVSYMKQRFYKRLY